MPNRQPNLTDASAYVGWNSPLATLGDDPDADVYWFTRAEERRIREFKIPGELRTRRRFNGSAQYYPRRPVESPSRWFKNHYVKLRQLELAEGLR